MSGFHRIAIKAFSISILSGFTLLASGASVFAADHKKQVNFYSYADYVDANSIKEFEKTTGIKVVYDTFDSVASAEAKMVTGSSGYDVVNSDIVTLERMAKAGIVHKLDKAKLPNWKNLDPAILKKMEGQDPGNNYMVPYFHGTNGFAYNVKRINKIMPDAPVDSLAMLFNPDIVKKFKSCGVNFFDSSSDVFAMALIYLGKDPNPKTTQDVDAAAEVIWKVRPYIRTFDPSSYIDALASGEICLSMTWAGDHLTALKKAKEAGTGVDLVYSVPKEGTVAWFDGFFIPKTAKNLDEAYTFLNMLLDPKVAAANINLWNYPGANIPAMPMVDKMISSDKGVYPPNEVFAKITAISNTPGIKFDKYMTTVWNKIKSGKK